MCKINERVTEPKKSIHFKVAETVSFKCNNETNEADFTSIISYLILTNQFPQLTQAISHFLQASVFEREIFIVIRRSQGVKEAADPKYMKQSTLNNQSQS